MRLTWRYALELKLECGRSVESTFKDDVEGRRGMSNGAEAHDLIKGSFQLLSGSGDENS